MHNKIHQPKIILLAFVAFVFIATALAAGLSLSHLRAHEQKNIPKIVDCQVLGDNYFVYFRDNQVSLYEVEASLCDSITFVNQDKFRLVAFGRHNDHISYNGIYEKPLNNGQSFSITLDKTGEYHFHDHYQEYIGGSFTVAEL